MQKGSEHLFGYIPGLTYVRGLAVVLVLLDHAHLVNALGHLGVDVFFVVSGFVITRSLLNSSYQSFDDFWSFMMRRCARLLPALFAVLFITLVCSISILPPSQWDRLLESSLWTIFSSSNFYFWKNVGYFDGLAELKPLIHTWSLGIEWQFYIALGVLFLLTNSMRWRNVVLVVVTIVSVGLMFYLDRTSPVATFYLLPTRAWELTLGVLLATVDRSHPLSRVRGISASLFWAALFLIAAWCLLLVPGVFAETFNRVVIAILTCLVIVTAAGSGVGTPSLHVPMRRFLYLVGLSSYSIYLIHQPLLALLKIELARTNNVALNGAVVLVSLALGFMMYRYVENNRSLVKVFLNFRHVLLAMSLGSTSVILLMVTPNVSGFIAGPLSIDQASQRSLVTESWGQEIYGNMYDDSACVFSVRTPEELPYQRLTTCYEKYGEPTVIIGDSHAVNVYNIFAYANVRAKLPFLVGIVQGGCRIHDDDGCHYSDLSKVISSLEFGVETLIYHQSGSYLLRDFSGQEDGEYLYLKEFQDAEFAVATDNIDSVMTYLKEFHANKIIWLGPFDELRIDVERAVERGEELKVRHRSEAYSSAVNEAVFEAAEANVIYVTFADFVQSERLPVFTDDCLIWRDLDHFSSCGERYIASIANFQKLAVAQ